jgi:hypothetical protein
MLGLLIASLGRPEQSYTFLLKMQRILIGSKLKIQIRRGLENQTVLT